MKCWTRTVVVAAIVCMVLTSSVRAGDTGAREKDLQAIRDLLTRYQNLLNDPAFAGTNSVERAELLRPFYRGDIPPRALNLDVETPLKDDELPLFFGPSPKPVVAGTEDHITNTLVNFSRLFNSGGTYRLKVDVEQILLDTQLAVVLMVTTSTFTKADGTSQEVRGRATGVLEKLPGNRWVVAHEHMALINARDQVSTTHK